jgi:hypothetical protein
LVRSQRKRLDPLSGVDGRKIRAERKRGGI